MRDKIVDIENFKKYGFQALDDTTKTKPGSLRVMRNAQVTLRGGLAPRPGTLLLGSSNSNTNPIKGFYNFRRSNGADEILIKAYADRIEFISKKYQSSGWQTLRTGYTNAKEFGFVTSLVNTDNQDFVIGANRYDPYFRWSGSLAKLTSLITAGDTTLHVDSTLLADIYESKTATGSSATTLTVSSATWAASQWVNFYVHITSGAQTGVISLISANTGTQITFGAITDPGLCTFEIRQIAFPATGTLSYNGGNQVAYSAIPTDSSFTTSSAPAAPVNTIVTTLPVEYAGNPRGNRLANYLTRIVVGKVRSALARGSGGALQGYSAAGSVFVSKLNNPIDFGYSAARVAGEGDLISMPYGGDDITDVQVQESTFYVFKPRYIESIQYSQDTNDLAVRVPLKSGYGSIGKTIKGSDDIYFFTADSQISSIGRLALKDQLPQTYNMGSPINRFLDTVGIDSDVGRGAEISNKVYFPLKRTPASTFNDIVLVFNRDTKQFEGIWDLSIFGIDQWNSEWYFGESNTPDVYELFQGHADVRGSDRFGIDFQVDTHFINLTASKGYLQAMSGIVIEGYVAGGATFTTNAYADFATNPFLTFDFSFDEEGFLNGEVSRAFLGSRPLAMGPETQVYGDPDSDGRRHFMFTVRFPFEYANYFSVGLESTEADSDFEITRFGLIIKETPSVNANLVKLI